MRLLPRSCDFNASGTKLLPDRRVRFPQRAEVAELADAPDSKSGSLRGVWVRFPPSALSRPAFEHDSPPPGPGGRTLERIKALGSILIAAFVVATGAGAETPAAPRVTVITDSVGGILSSATKTRAKLGARLDLRLEAETCRKLVDPGCPTYDNDAPESALATIERLGPALGSVVVIDVGYNDHYDLYGAGIDEVMRALDAAGVQHVVWVTLEETEPGWRETNEVIRAAPARWAQIAVAEWATASAGRPWFVDHAHMNDQGAVAFGAFLRPFVLDACGVPCAPPPPAFCGLARTVNGFDAVAASVVACGVALTTIVRLERGDRGDWSCSRAVGGAVELDCRRGESRLQVLERSPIAAVRHRGVVSLANWVFRLRGSRLEGRSRVGPWRLLIAKAPYCEPAAPHEVLVALRLRPQTRHGGCFVPP